MNWLTSCRNEVCTLISVLWVAAILHDVTDRLTHDIDAIPPSGDPLWNQWGTLVESVAEIGARRRCEGSALIEGYVFTSIIPLTRPTT